MKVFFELEHVIINRQLRIPLFLQNWDIRIEKIINQWNSGQSTVSKLQIPHFWDYVRPSRLCRNELKMHVDRPSGGFKKRIFGRYRHLTIYYHMLYYIIICYFIHFSTNRCHAYNNLFSHQWRHLADIFNIYDHIMYLSSRYLLVHYLEQASYLTM